MVPLSNRLATLWDPTRPAQRQLVVLGAGLGILAWAYWPNLQDLCAIWLTQPNYSHGILVVPFALVIFWQRLADAEVPWTGSKAPWWSWAILVAVLVARASSYEQNSQWSETATLIPAVACLVFTLGGWPLLERAWPAVIFLVFMLPLAAGNRCDGLPATSGDRHAGKCLHDAADGTASDGRRECHPPPRRPARCQDA